MRVAFSVSRFLLPRVAPLALALGAACGGGGGTTEPPPDTSQFAPIGAAAQIGRQASTLFEQLAAANDANLAGKLVAALQAEPGVAQVQLLANSGVILTRMTSGIGFGMSIAEKSLAQWTPVNPAPQAVAKGPSEPTTRRSGGPIMSLAELRRRVALEFAIVCGPTNFPQSKKACVVNGFQAEFQQDMTSINSSLTKSGFTPTPYGLKNTADLAKLRDDLGTCGVLYMSSHGTQTNELANNSLGTHITTEIELPSDPSARDQVLNFVSASLGADGKAAMGWTVHKGKAYVTLSPFFFAKADYPNTLVYADACNSADASGGATTIKEMVEAKGAGGFFGWEGPITNKVSNPAADQIFDAMAPKVASNSTVTMAVNPPAPGPGEPYVVTATITPAAAGVPMELSVRGTDGFTRDEPRTTDAAGQVTFASIPGGAAGVTDTVTVSAGGAQDSNAAVNAIGNSPTLQQAYRLSWSPADGSLSRFSTFFKGKDFNLACNNANVVKTGTVVKFQP